MQSLRFDAALKTVLKAAPFVVLALMFVINSAEAAAIRLPKATTAQMAYVPSSGVRNGLPATSLDSFVAQAKKFGVADQIYGDEGQGANPPPYKGFTAQHRINAGIRGEQDAGLSTGHGSMLPDAWGRDEFIGGLEMSQGGYNNNAYARVSTPDILSSNEMPPVAPSFRGSSDYDMSGITSGAPLAVSAAY